eukprot:7033821-Pyramimonas_sp.AAC.1
MYAVLTCSKSCLKEFQEHHADFVPLSDAADTWKTIQAQSENPATPYSELPSLEPYVSQVITIHTLSPKLGFCSASLDQHQIGRPQSRGEVPYRQRSREVDAVKRHQMYLFPARRITATNPVLDDSLITQTRYLTR